MHVDMPYMYVHPTHTKKVIRKKVRKKLHIATSRHHIYVYVKSLEIASAELPLVQFVACRYEMVYKDYYKVFFCKLTLIWNISYHPSVSSAGDVVCHAYY